MGTFRTSRWWWRFAVPVIALLFPLAMVGQTVDENHERITALEGLLAETRLGVAENSDRYNSNALAIGRLANSIVDNRNSITHNASAIAANQNSIGSNAHAIADNRQMIHDVVDTGTPPDTEVLEAVRYLRAQFEALGDVSDTPGTWTLYWLQAGGCDTVDVSFPDRAEPAASTQIRLPASAWKSVNGAVLLCQIDLYPNGPWSARSYSALRVWAIHETGIALWWPVDPDGG